MKHAALALFTVIVLAAGTGCSALHGVFIHGGGGCESCGGGGCESCGQSPCETCGGAGCDSCGQEGVAPASFLGQHRCRNCGKDLQPPQGPPTGAVTYPYYTTHGPRDFLIDNPPSIGR